jgi:hypothetical protein
MKLKKLMAAACVAAFLTLGLATPAEAHTTTVRQGEDEATVVDNTRFSHDRVRIHDKECDGRVLRVEAIFKDGTRYTMWNFEGCGTTEVSTLNKKIESFRLCEVGLCTPWKDA